MESLGSPPCGDQDVVLLSPCLGPKGDQAMAQRIPSTNMVKYLYSFTLNKNININFIQKCMF